MRCSHIRLAILSLFVGSSLCVYEPAFATESPAGREQEARDTKPGANTIKFAFPKNKSSAFSKTDIPAGTNLEFHGDTLKTNETLLVFKCGVPCNTAKLIRTWNANDFPSGASALLVVTEPGRYYFWIQKTTPNGEIGPVFGESIDVKGKTYIVHYVSGTTVSVTPSSP